jgi:hypothetical protein
MHVDRRLTWAKHIKTQRKQLNQKAKQMHRLLGRRSIRSIESKLLYIYSNTQIYSDIRNSAMGDSLQFHQRNPPALSVQDSPIHSERTLVHKQPQDPRRSTNEYSAQ